MPEPPKPKGDADASAAKGSPPAGLGFGAARKAEPLDEAAAAATKGVFAASVPAVPPPAGSKAPPQPGADANDPVDALFRISAPPITVPRRLQARHQVSVDVEPVAALFGSEVIVPAPSLPPEPSEAELGRMQATGRTSVFGDLVRDPPPPPEVAVPRAPRVPSIVLELADEAPLPPAQSAPKTAPPPVPADAGEKRKARKKQAPPSAEKAAAEVRAQAPAPPTAPAPAPAQASAAPRIAAAAVGALALLLSLGVVLGVIPNPFAASPAPVAAPPAAPIRLPAPVPVAQPSPAPAPQAAPKPPVPAAAATAPAAEKPAQPAAVVAAPAKKVPEPAAAAPKTRAAEPAVTTAPKPPAEPAKPLAAKPAAAAAPTEPAAAKPAAEADQSSAGTAALVTAARKKLAEDEPKAAEALLRQAFEIDPQDHHVMELLAHALMDQERGQEALVFARKIVQRRPRRAPYRLLLGDLLLMVGDEAGAKAEWQKALALTPDDVQIKRRLGM